MSWRRGVATVALLAMAAVGCSSGAADPADDAAPATTDRRTSATSGSPAAPAAPTSTGTAPTARFEDDDCRFDVPDGYEVRCGWLVVAEDRSVPAAGGNEVRLHVGVFHKDDVDARPDPVVYLEGGPGGNALDNAVGDFDGRFGLYAQDRDVVVFDQRGTGHSTPSLACPEVRELSLSQLDRDLPVADELAATRDALVQCRDRLVGDGADLTRYNSETSAADVADLRQALGYDEWNVLGVSYGTRLAQTLLRIHPEGIRSVILDSTYPVAVDSLAELPERMAEAFDRFFTACEVDATCARAAPDLRRRFDALATRMEQQPTEVQVTVDGDQRPAVIDGAGLRDLLFLSLYDAGLLRSVPRMVAELEAGVTDTLGQLATVSVAQLDGVSLGDFLSVQCHEEVPFADRAVVAAGPSRHPELAENLEAQLVDGPGAFDTCALWGAGTAPPVEDEPVHSDVPTLVVGGQFDPVTPNAWGQAVAAEFDRARFVSYPGLGHGVATAEGCPAAVTTAFLEDPVAFVQSPGATACATTMTTPPLHGPAPAQLELEGFEATTQGATVTGQRPVGWDEVQVGVAARQHDFADPTALITFGAPGASAKEVLAALRLDDDARATGDSVHGGVTWTAYEGTTQGTPIDLRVARIDGIEVLVALVSTPTEREALIRGVLDRVTATIGARRG